MRKPRVEASPVMFALADEKWELVSRMRVRMLSHDVTYLIFGELKIVFDGFGNQRRKGEPRETVNSST